MLIKLFTLYSYTPTNCIPGHTPLGEQTHGAVRQSEQVTGLLQLHQEHHVYGQTGGVLGFSLEDGGALSHVQLRDPHIKVIHGLAALAEREAGEYFFREPPYK